MIRFSPGCNCCDVECNVFDDNFNRTDSGSLGSNWTEVEPGIGITSNAAKSVASGGLTICNTTPARSKYKVSAKIGLGADGDIGGIVVNYQDDENFTWVEVHRTGSTTELLQLWHRVSGVDTKLATNYFWPFVSLPGTLEVWVWDSVVTGSGSRGPYARNVTTPSGRGVGLFSRSVVDYVTWDDFAVDLHYTPKLTDCPQYDCSYCERCAEGVPPVFLEVSMSGWTTPSPGCSGGHANPCENDLDSLNRGLAGPWILRCPGYALSGAELCSWRFPVSSSLWSGIYCYDSVTIISTLSHVSGTTYKLTVQLLCFYGGVSETFVWDKTFSDLQNCFDWDETLTLSSSPASPRCTPPDEVTVKPVFFVSLLY